MKELVKLYQRVQNLYLVLLKMACLVVNIKKQARTYCQPTRFVFPGRKFLEVYFVFFGTISIQSEDIFLLGKFYGKQKKNRVGWQKVLAFYQCLLISMPSLLISATNFAPFYRASNSVYTYVFWSFFTAK